MVSETAQGGGLTQENALMGTPDFIAPEQATDARTADIRSDIYSLGCTLYYLLTAQPPFPEGTAIQKVLAHLERKPKSVSELRKEMPAQVAAILDRMLAKDPTQRYQTPAQVAQALTPFAKLNAAPTESEAAPKAIPAAPKPPTAALPLLKYAAKAFIKVSGNVVGFGIGGDFLVEVAPRIIEEIWKGWGSQKNDAQRKAELAALALLSPKEISARADAIINEVAADQPSEVKEAARSYLAQLPDAVRKSLQRPEDLTGTSIPPDFSISKAEDLQPFLSVMSTESPVLARRAGSQKRAKSKRSLLVAIGGGAVALLILVAVIIVRFSGPDGDGVLIIETVDPDAEVIVRQGGKEIAILDKKTRQEVKLPIGVYQFELGGKKKGLRLETRQYTLKTGDREVVRVTWEPDQPIAQGKETTGEVPSTKQKLTPDGPTVQSPSKTKVAPLSGREVRTLKGHTGAVASVVFSPDGKHIVSGGGDMTANDRKGKVKIWDAESGNNIATLEGHTSGVRSVIFSPKGNHIISGAGDQSQKGRDGTVRIWDAVNGNPLQTRNGETASVTGLAYSPDGLRIVIAGDKSLKLWDPSTDRVTVGFEGHASYVNCVIFSTDGNRVIAGSDNLKAWQAGTGREILTYKGHTSYVNCVAASPDGTRIVSGSFDNTLRVWEEATGQCLHTLQGHTASVAGVAFSRDSKRIVSGSFDKTLKMWDAVSGEELLTLRGHTDAVLSVAFSPDGGRIVSGSGDRTVMVWEILEPK